MGDVEAAQRALNLQTADSWASFAEHRRRVTALLGGRLQGLRLCVLGAGNCNDLDFTELVPRFREIVLVDVDSSSLESAATRQPREVQAALKLRAPLDFSAWAELSGTPDRSAASIVQRLAAQIDPEPFDMVVSTCVLSQIIDQVRQRCGDDSERCLALVQTARELHLALLQQLLRRGGRGVLVSDMVSSDTAPELARTPAQALPQLMAELVAAKNFFTGLNPFVLDALFKQHPTLAPRVGRTAFHSPWLWELGAGRTYLTYAVSFERI